MSEDLSSTLLAVEDDPGQARLIERNLRRAHLSYPIVLLCDGQAVLDYLLPAREEQGHSQPPPRHIVLLDLNPRGSSSGMSQEP